MMVLYTVALYKANIYSYDSNADEEEKNRSKGSVILIRIQEKKGQYQRTKKYVRWDRV